MKKADGRDWNEETGQFIFSSARSGLFFVLMISQGVALGCGWAAPLGLLT